MRFVVAALLLTLIPRGAVAQPADCPVEQPGGPTLPLWLDLAGRPGVPSGAAGQAYINMPMTPPGLACEDTEPPPRDVPHGEPGDVLRGPGTPHVDVQIR
jgi:hypothetical protein